ncbi:MAG TPA: sugar phosphate isomerase/epimerase [Saprospiraceae bacterium]|nr:sugar phosphate isomerase/epimerase [Saprospiraceae bacterium]
MQRREFIQQTGIMGTVFLLSPAEVYKIKARHVGIQMWSVRGFADKDPIGTISKLAAMGYREIEGHKYADGKFYTWTPKEFRTQLKNAGLKMPSAHTAVNLQSWDAQKQDLSDGMKRCIDAHAELGVKQLLCPHIDKEYRNEEDINKLTGILNHVGALCKKAGMQFGYHNHDFEFSKTNGKYMMDTIMVQTDPDLVIWEMDLYWVKFAHEDPIQWIKKYPGRINAFHVKDMANTAGHETIEVGDGTIDFANIFSHSKEAGVKYFIVELEHYRTNSMDGVEKSLRNLKGILETSNKQ